MNGRTVALGLLLMAAPAHQPVRAVDFMTMSACLVGVSTARKGLELSPLDDTAALAVCTAAYDGSWDLVQGTPMPRVAGCSMGTSNTYVLAGHRAELTPASKRFQRATDLCEEVVLLLAKGSK